MDEPEEDRENTIQQTIVETTLGPVRLL